MLNRCRRLAKDFENLTDNALAFLRLASIRLMLRRLCNPSSTFRTDSQSDKTDHIAMHKGPVLKKLSAK